MASGVDSEAFSKSLRKLIEKWCDRRCLKALYRVLPGYVGFNGLTDGWAGLHLALQDVRAFARDELRLDELEQLDELIRVADRATHRK
jgi:hypothetical protein